MYQVALHCQSLCKIVRSDIEPWQHLFGDSIDGCRIKETVEYEQAFAEDMLHLPLGSIDKAEDALVMSKSTK